MQALSVSAEAQEALAADGKLVRSGRSWCSTAATRVLVGFDEEKWQKELSVR